MISKINKKVLKTTTPSPLVGSVMNSVRQSGEKFVPHSKVKLYQPIHEQKK